MSEEVKHTPTQCQSYRDGYVCADGFVQKPLCRGVFGCPHCGRASDADTPNCMKDELPAHYVNDDGSPRFYRQMDASPALPESQS